MCLMAAQASGTNDVIRLIRSRETGQFFAKNGWTTNPEQAAEFGDSILAIRACIEHDLTNVELVLRSPGTTHDLFSTALR